MACTADRYKMDEADRDVILRYAAGERQLRDEAIAIHRRYIPTLGVRGTPEQRYMAEVDHSVPDLGLRRKYRDALLEGIG